MTLKMTTQRRPTTRAALRKSMRCSSLAAPSDDATASKLVVAGWRRRLAKTKCSFSLAGSFPFSSSTSCALMKMFVLWAVVIVFDMTVEIRAELLWPLFLHAKNCYDAWKYHGCMFGLTFLLVSLFSDFAMCFVIPVRWLAIASITFLCIQLYKTSVMGSTTTTAANTHPPLSTAVTSTSSSNSTIPSLYGGIACVFVIWIILVYLCNHVPCLISTGRFKWWRFVMVNVLVYPLITIMCGIRNRFRCAYHASGGSLIKTVVFCVSGLNAKRHLQAVLQRSSDVFGQFIRWLICWWTAIKKRLLVAAAAKPTSRRSSSNKPTRSENNDVVVDDDDDDDNHREIDASTKSANVAVQCDLSVTSPASETTTNSKRRLDELAKVQADAKRLRADLQRLRSSEGQLRSKNQNLTTELSKYKADKREKDELYNRVKRMTTNDHSHRATILSLTSELQKLKEQVTYMQKSADDQKKREQNLSTDCKILGDQVNDLLNSQQELERKLQSKDDRIIDTERLFNEEKVQLTHSINDLNLEIERILRKNKGLADEANRLQNEIVNLEIKMRSEAERTGKLLHEYDQLKQESIRCQCRFRDLQAFNSSLVTVFKKFVPPDVFSSIVGPIATTAAFLATSAAGSSSPSPPPLVRSRCFTHGTGSNGGLVGAAAMMGGSSYHPSSISAARDGEFHRHRTRVARSPPPNRQQQQIVPRFTGSIFNPPNQHMTMYGTILPSTPEQLMPIDPANNNNFDYHHHHHNHHHHHHYRTYSGPFAVSSNEAPPGLQAPFLAGPPAGALMFNRTRSAAGGGGTQGSDDDDAAVVVEQSWSNANMVAALSGGASAEDVTNGGTYPPRHQHHYRPPTQSPPTTSSSNAETSKKSGGDSLTYNNHPNRGNEWF